MAPANPQIAKLGSLLLTLLPLIILLPSLILSIYSASNKDWTYRTVYDENSDSNTPPVKGITHRSPFTNCALSSSTNNSTNVTFTETCFSIRSPSGLCDASSTTAKGDNAHFCEQLSLSARLLYAGNALIVAGFVVAAGLTIWTVPQVLKTGGSYASGAEYQAVPSNSHSHRHRHQDAPARRPPVHTLSAYGSLLLRLLTVFGGAILFLGTFIATNTLVNIQFPIGDWYTTGDPNIQDIITQDHVGPWLIGQAVGWSVAAAVLAVVAGAFAGAVWEGPRVGVVDGSVADAEHVGEEQPKVGNGEQQAAEASV